jgi:hypothetical protein
MNKVSISESLPDEGVTVWLYQYDDPPVLGHWTYLRLITSFYFTTTMETPNIHITEDGTDLTNAVLLIDSHHGQYIPQLFADKFGQFIENEAYNADLLSPDGEFYWESWEYVLDNTTIQIEGKPYTLYQDGDLFALPVEVTPTYEYYINTDERGEFAADVRNLDGETVLAFDGDDMFTDGFMKHKHDLKGLHSYLVSVGRIQESDQLIQGN